MNLPRMALVGTGPLADSLRRSLRDQRVTDEQAAVADRTAFDGRTVVDDRTAVDGYGELDGLVLVGPPPSRPRPFAELTDADWDDAWEQPMRWAVSVLASAQRRRIPHIVVVVPTTGMSGGAEYVAEAATAEALRVLVKSAARQWGADGITVNAIAVHPELAGIDPVHAGAVSLSPPALSGVDASAVARLITAVCSGSHDALTGATLTVDGGLWMAP